MKHPSRRRQAQAKRLLLASGFTVSIDDRWHYTVPVGKPDPSRHSPGTRVTCDPGTYPLKEIIGRLSWTEAYKLNSDLENAVIAVAEQLTLRQRLKRIFGTSEN